MDLEALIAQITEEVCIRIQNENAKIFGSADLARHMEYTLINPRIHIEEIRRMCEAAKQKNYACVCVPQWFVAVAKDLLQDSGTKVSTPVGLPGGTSSTAAKYAEVKEAVANGADEVDIPINMQLLQNSDLDGVKKDLEEAMGPAKDKALVKAVVETGSISSSQIAIAIEVCKQCNVEYVTVSNILSGRVHDASDVKEIVCLCNDEIKVKAIGEIKDYSTANTFIAVGIDRIGTSKAETMA